MGFIQDMSAIVCGPCDRSDQLPAPDCEGEPCQYAARSAIVTEGSPAKPPAKTTRARGRKQKEGGPPPSSVCEKCGKPVGRMANGQPYRLCWDCDQNQQHRLRNKRADMDRMVKD